MIDTVKYSIGECVFKTLPEGWWAQTIAGRKNEPNRANVKKSSSCKTYKHKKTGLSITKKDQGTYVEVSLPRLLFGTNSRLITSQSQITDALQMADALVSTIATPRIPQRQFLRVDLAWQILGNIDKFIFALFGYSYAGIQKPGTIYQHETIQWSSDSMSVKVYDKMREMKKWRAQNGYVLRLELTLRKAKLRKLFGVEQLEELNFSQCYQIFRNHFLMLFPRALPKIRKKTDIYALAIKYKWEIDGLPAIAWMLQQLRPDHRRKKIKELSEYSLIFENTDLKRQFPEKGPLPVRKTCFTKGPLKGEKIDFSFPRWAFTKAK